MKTKHLTFPVTTKSLQEVDNKEDKQTLEARKSLPGQDVEG